MNVHRISHEDEAVDLFGLGSDAERACAFTLREPLSVAVFDIAGDDVMARALVVDTQACDPSLYRVEVDSYQPEPWETEE